MRFMLTPGNGAGPVGTARKTLTRLFGFVFRVAVGFLHLAGDLLDIAFGLDARVTDSFTGNFLDFALGLFDTAFDLILVHGSLLFLDWKAYPYRWARVICGGDLSDLAQGHWSQGYGEANPRTISGSPMLL